MDRIPPVVISEIDVADDCSSLRFMATYYGKSIKNGFGKTYTDAIWDLLKAIDGRDRRMR